MHEVLKSLKKRYPDLKFSAGRQFCWAPEAGEIVYKKGSESDQMVWSLLHETGHALLGHAGYQADLELLRLEVAAWDKARQLAGELDIKIDEDHIQDCLDTYRDWLYGRSICPDCTAKSLQQGDFVHYRCFNCHRVWRVGPNRFGRTYRRTKVKTPPERSFYFT